MTPRLCSLLFVIILLSFPAQAEVLSIVNWRGRQVLQLSGPIEDGTAKRFADKMDKVAPFPHGMPVLLLDGSGGSVSEALAMSRLMDITPFHTVVPDGAKCASACASILFIAGTYRTVEPFGSLGQHSCSVNGVPNEACNKELSQYALSHGVSYGSVAAFVTYVPPNEILWFSREDADGFGLTRYAGEQESGFQKSEPQVIKLLTGRMPPAQAAWRLDFREDGYRAFLRPVSDAERKLQLNLFCNENLSGRLFLSMEIYGSATIISNAVLGLSVETDLFSWSDLTPTIWQADAQVTEVITEVPQKYIISILSNANDFSFNIRMKSPYNPIITQTYLSSSRRVLSFAANNCASRKFNGARAPLN